MMRDYAKPFPRYTPPRKRGKGWLVLILIAIVIAATIFVYKHHAQLTRHFSLEHQKAAIAAVKPSSITTATKPLTSSTTVTKSPNFDFYTILPNMQVPANQPAAPNITPPTIPAKNTITKMTTPNVVKAPVANNTPLSPVTIKTAVPVKGYFLQIASLRSLDDANQLKAQLALLGFAAVIQTYQAGDMIWHRVSVGPYETAATAKADQTRLRYHQIDSLLVNQGGFPRQAVG